VKVGIVEPGNDAAALEINDEGVRAARILFALVHGNNAAILDREIGGFGMRGIEGGDASVVNDEVCLVRGVHSCIG
jgi:hypothetical protein